jgi:hypothetical protein
MRKRGITVRGITMIGEKHIRYIALESHVLLVCVENEGIDYSVYIGAVPGHNHEHEYQMVAAEGNKVDKKLAELYFESDLPWRN